MYCENESCKKEHDGSYGSGRFCSINCSKSYSSNVNKASRLKKISKTLSPDDIIKEDGFYYYACEKCKCKFKKKYKIRNGRPKHCENCIRKVPHTKNLDKIENLLQFSKRTVAKVLKRAGVACLICGYNKTSLDIHHIDEKKNGGTDDHSNLIAVCPNCHREAHEGLIEKTVLFENCLEIRFKDWKEYYNKSK